MPGKPTGPRVLYIVYWGAAEPLGQALVVPAVRRLADLGAQITLVTFEKPSDLENQSDQRRIRKSLEPHRIRWLPLRYHRHPKLLAKPLDFVQGMATALLHNLATPFDIIHARTFIGGLFGLLLAPILGAKLIYHNEGFYPDEQVDGGVWKQNSLPHRIAKTLEYRMYSSADGIITMSHRGKRVIDQLPTVRSKRTPTIVVPSCVDLDRFKVPRTNAIPTNLIRLVYAGSIGGRYRLDQIASFAAAVSKISGSVHLRVLTKAPPDVVESIVTQGGMRNEEWSVRSVAPQEIPTELHHQHAGLHFLNKGISEHGGSPTKIGEYWAAGLPVVATPNMGDIDEIAIRLKVGVVVQEHTESEYRNAVLELIQLLADPELQQRCRIAAEQIYALEPSCVAQFDLYTAF